MTHLEKRRSNHLPLLVNIRKNADAQSERKKRRRLFRFEEMWTRDDSCVDVSKAKAMAARPCSFYCHRRGPLRCCA